MNSGSCNHRVPQLISTIIWPFPQYALAAGMSDNVIKAVTGLEIRSKSDAVICYYCGLWFVFLGN